MTEGSGRERERERERQRDRERERDGLSQLLHAPVPASDVCVCVFKEKVSD